MKLIDKKDSRYFTETSKDPYIRHRYKLVDAHGDFVIFDNWEDTQMMWWNTCLLYTSPSPRDRTRSRMPSSA